MMQEVFDLDGVLIGWIGYSKAAGRDAFVPRAHRTGSPRHRRHAATSRPGRKKAWATVFPARSA
jgi:hypothetical protein